MSWTSDIPCRKVKWQTFLKDTKTQMKNVSFEIKRAE